MLELTALKKEVFDFIGKELKYIGIALALVFVALKVTFYKESLLVVLRTSVSLFWLFILPGYSLMLYWREKLEFAERFVIGVLLSAAVMGIFSYYFGLMGLSIRYHAFILPPVIIVIGLIAAMKKKASSS